MLHQRWVDFGECVACGTCNAVSVPVHIILHDHVHVYEFEIWNDREYVRDCLRDVYLLIVLLDA
jgi:hypothetical protein